MPELPEVEAMTRRLRRAAEGRTLTRLVAVDPRVLRIHPGAPEGTGGPIEHIQRRAKHLCFRVGDAAWILHFRMTGLLVRGPGERFVRAQLWVDGAPALALEDPRHLAEIHRLHADELAGMLAGLGPEPWPERRDAVWWAERLRGATGPLKPALMDQARIGGLGNIAASEICFRARLSPRIRAGALDASALTRLAQAAAGFLEQAVHEADTEDLAYINAGGPNPFQVYQRQGEPCPRCGAPIERFVQAGRGTWMCPSCQPERLSSP